MKFCIKIERREILMEILTVMNVLGDLELQVRIQKTYVSFSNATGQGFPLLVNPGNLIQSFSEISVFRVMS